jgi:glucose-fructose oxidoreductase
MSQTESSNGGARRKIRYGVVGAGHIAQVAILPAFEHAENAELVALFSGDPEKRRVLGARYGIEHALDYDGYDDALSNGLVDAVYIALPNHLHCDYTVRAARGGVHVLCEKPMAIDERECEQMIRACEEFHVELMIAYRLHFERANLEAIEIAESDELGDVRLFESLFSQDVQDGDIRLSPIGVGGGTVYDMGVYCINAARCLFRDEPTEVLATSVNSDEPRFSHCDEATSAIMKFPEARLATFISSFGAHRNSRYSLIGTKGRLTMDPAFEYATELRFRVDNEHGTRVERFEKRDQFGPELVYFSDCILEGRRPEPDGLTGMADVHIIRSIHQSVAEERPIRLLPVRQLQRPDLSQEITRPGIEKPEEIHASGPSRG